MIGAAISTAVAISCLYLAGLLQVKILLNVWPYDRRYIKGVISALVASLSLYVINRFLNFYSPLTVLIVNMIASVVGFSLTMLLLGLDDEDREFIRILKYRIKGKKKIEGAKR
jgi:hypothetical protein